MLLTRDGFGDGVGVGQGSAIREATLHQHFLSPKLQLQEPRAKRANAQHDAMCSRHVESDISYKTCTHPGRASNLGVRLLYLALDLSQYRQLYQLSVLGSSWNQFTV